MNQCASRDIFLQIEPLADYSPLAPLLCARRYGRDCQFNEGHELGRIPAEEILEARVDALVYREYLDADYTVPNTAPLVPSDSAEPPWDRRVPSAIIWAKPGERLRIHVRNADPHDCHSLHVHGLRYGIDSDGAWPRGVATKDGRRSDEILPGQTWTYVFDITEQMVGAWPFHDHVRHVQMNINRGLLGGLIVRDPRATRVDHEVPMFFHVMAGSSGSVQFESSMLSHLDVFKFKFLVADQVTDYICRIHGPSMAGRVRVVAGAPGPAANVKIEDNKFTPADITITAGTEVIWTNAGDNQHIVFSGGGGKASFCLNGRAFVGNTPIITANSGETIRWYLFNLDVGSMWHNFHPHASRWQIPSPPGGASDVHALSPVETFIVDTEVPPALRLPCELEQLQCCPPADACLTELCADFLFHCHVEEHMMAGLVGLIRARQKIWITDAVLKQTNLVLPLGCCDNECAPVDLSRCMVRKPQPPRPQPPTHGDNPMLMAMPAGEGVPEHVVQMQPHAHTLEAMVHEHEFEPVVVPATGPVDAVAAAKIGYWELLPCELPVLAVHAALMHTGRIVFFAGSGNDDLYTTGFRSAVYDYENGTMTMPNTPTDVFCAHQSFLPDGRLLVAGGTERYDPFVGLKTALLFDPATEQWTFVHPMKWGRWYPALITLGDGRVMATSGGGSPEDEIYSNPTGWSIAGPGIGWPLYPHLNLLADGRVFHSGMRLGGSGMLPGFLTPATGAYAPLPAAAIPASFNFGARDQGATVLLPPAQMQKVMVMGGGSPSINAVHIIDTDAPSPHYVAAPSMLRNRVHVNAVILPDRTVVATGGSGIAENALTASTEAEIYDPVTNSWTTGARARVPRMYHSIALLLPDARVLTAGSNPSRRNDEMRLEVYHPPYLFRGPRPCIESAPSELTLGDSFTVHIPDTADIKWLSLVRPMATTHSCDNEQRLIDITFRRGGVCKLVAHLSDNANLVPPGHYMLFAVNQRGVPSMAHWVRVKSKLEKIRTVKIHPAIGIARVGNSPNEFFVGPEIPGDSTPPAGGYKDKSHRVKRQAARFRLFGYDEHGNLVQELDAKDANIRWTVHLANKKAAGPRFEGLKQGTPPRNAGVADRKTLIIEPGARSISGPSQAASFDNGSFLGTKVPLGEIRTDEQGRLLVLGGFGHSASPTHAPITTFANNDGWHDDVSDGPVSATVELHGINQTLHAVGAWAIVGPPKFAPAIESITTLYDVLLQTAVDKLGLALPEQPSFTRDIYPLLARVTQMKWVSALSGSAHKTLAAILPPPGPDAVRAAIFERLLNPNDGSGGDMPMIWSDHYGMQADERAAPRAKAEMHEAENQPVTRIQYRMLAQWKDGDFVNDWNGPPAPSAEITPAGLDRAALQSCVGGAFYPGIEAGWLMRDVLQFDEPFRLSHATLSAGEITQQMSVPWQSDFNDCQYEEPLAWWPAQRPDDVFVGSSDTPLKWTRGIVDSPEDMIKRWHQLGFVVKDGARFVESERKDKD
ncbi:LodA/GoxA family CTQ-dependent oxidase [Piscinibacter sp.]|jgi:FtsP/CotA-like multicopper oxidase with cupredoxin domain|uniref:LodA/GoxA family CTQ-dependent oxidase n=1 Tax=Piscinibacter sp. TaxID=1903157 RepID=UPI003559A8C4